MRLIRVGIQGYGRFAEPQTLTADRKLTALVGRNESGKTTLLEALQLLNDQEPMNPRRLTRFDSGHKPLVFAEFALDDDDRAELAEVRGIESASLYRYWKTAEGRVHHSLTPRLDRDHTLRERSVSDLKKAASSKHAASLDEKMRSALEVTEDDSTEWIPVADRMRDSADRLNRQMHQLTIDEELINTIETFASELEPIVEGLTVKYLAELPALLLRLTQDEREPSPHAEALDALYERIPYFALYREEDRQFRESYSIEEMLEEPPTSPLANLAAFAGLSLADLAHAMEQGDLSRATSLTEAANHRLTEQLDKWTQEKTTVRLTAGGGDGRQMTISIGSVERQFFPPDQRSEGLRWFLGLLAFLHVSVRAEQGVVLLVDEAELHLHYDAQADLISELAQQSRVRSVIYTTHSAGCLPPDLSAVRVVVQDENAGTSSIVNWFWTTHDSSMSAVIMRMGATNFAFVFCRAALVAEGPSDHLLLPQLLREATGEDELPYQVVGGLSEIANDRLPALEREGARVMYLVDTDEGGRNLEGALLASSVPQERIVRIWSSRGRESEDLVSPEALARAVNAVLAETTGEQPPRIEASQIRGHPRWDRVMAWCDTQGIAHPSKVQVARHLVDPLDGNRAAQPIHDPAAADHLRSLHTQVVAYFG